MKTTEEIYEELLSVYTQRAGYRPEDDCDLAVRLYAAAAEIQALLIQSDWVLNQSFPQSAEGEYLDQHAAVRGITRMAAGKAAGTLRFSVDSAAPDDLTIESGTVCMSAGGVRFATIADAVLAAGDLSVDAAAMAVEAGKNGNLGAGSITIMTACPVGITAVTNPAAFTGGTDAEDDEALRTRILTSYRRLPNGANAAFYEETAISHAGVAAAKAVGRARGVGTVDVYVVAPAGIPDETLLAAVEADLSAKREIAVDVEVKAPTAQSVNVSAAIAVESGGEFAAVKANVENALAGYFTGKMLGKGVTIAGLLGLICAVPGVANCHLSAPNADLAAADTTLPVLGTVSITELEA